MKSFNPINAPLQGVSLIEASAGTGKTYTLTTLFLKLLLEKELPPDRILVVTFTKAATEELKDRIRMRLVEAREAFLAGTSEDRLLSELVRRQEDPTRAIRFIRNALIDFDRIAIYTIHGFCQSLLAEFAFATEMPFESEFIADYLPVYQEVADDFWRTRFYDNPPELLAYLLKIIPGPDYFRNLLLQLNSPSARIIPDSVEPDLKSLIPYRKARERIGFQWSEWRDSVIEALMDPGLNGTVYGGLTAKNAADPSPRSIRVMALVESTEKFLGPNHIGFPFPEILEKMTTGRITAAAKKNHLSPRHPAFDAFQELADLNNSLIGEMKRFHVYLLTEFFKYSEKELSFRKKQRNVLFYDDLLLAVHGALKKENCRLAQAVRQKYTAALVDEFQDTDSIQYEIFSRLFGEGVTGFYMIGDPKQAIYSFRGADIFSYLQASDAAKNRFTLTENWRSTPELIEAVNTLFGRIRHPFLFEAIGFSAGRAAVKHDGLNPKFSPAMILWHLEAKSAPFINKSKAVDLLADSVAEEICRLVNDSRSGLKTGDIAVLVRTHRQARIVQQSLAARSIPSVLYSSGSVFETPEAEELERILESISEPLNDARYRSARATEILGGTAEEILDSTTDIESAEQEEGRGRLHEYYRLWERFGFYRMFRRWAADENIEARLLSFPDGERRVTNLLHLAELLQQASFEKRLGMTGLIKWLVEQRFSPVPENETEQLRLETDALAVQIITIHKAKGLEYPVVFCPFTWEGVRAPAVPVFFHDPENNGQLTLDLGSETFGKSCTQSRKEALAEELRLLYVALTRARALCYFAWGPIRGSGSSALSYLLHGGDFDLSQEDMVTALENRSDRTDDKEMRLILDELAAESDGTIECRPVPETTGCSYHPFPINSATLNCREFSGHIDSGWGITSFSGFLSSAATPGSPRDDNTDLKTDRVVEKGRETAKGQISEILERPADKSIHAFPGGTRTGLFFHDLFETVDFSFDEPDKIREHVEKKLLQYRFESAWTPAVCSTLKNVLSVPIAYQGKTFSLSQVGVENRIHEMEFHLPMKKVTPKLLSRLFREMPETDHAIFKTFPEKLEKLSFPLVKGYMKGFIDLVFRVDGRFFIIDWKSNDLGPGIDHYHQSRLGEVMESHSYHLQSYLYSLALHRHLSTQLEGYRPEKHLGCIYYIFIRGIAPEHGAEYGIYASRPSPEAMKMMELRLVQDFKGWERRND